MSVLSSIARALMGREPYDPRREPEGIRAIRNSKRAGGSGYYFPRIGKIRDEDLTVHQRLTQLLNPKPQDTVILSQQETPPSPVERKRNFWDWFWGNKDPFLPSQKSPPGNPERA